MISIENADPAELARVWLAVDPDAKTRAETEQLIEAGGAALAERFGESLTFGTAGLRGKLGAGPNRMNRVLVRLVAAAIADMVVDEPDPHVVVGFDARHGSADFAADTARVLLARGVRCTTLSHPLPTPVLAFSVRHLEASAGVMVTASHNPRDDNGYKVYWRGGALLTPPRDEQIAAAMRNLSLLGDLDLVPESDSRLIPGPAHLLDDYIEAALTTLDATNSRSALVVHTALHGVGTETIARAFEAAGFAAPITVPEQSEPDPDFPTAPFPNPEEPGTLDLLLDLGDASGADLALANDPDADRLAVAVPTPSGWRNLSGDDLGCLLADHRLRQETDDGRTPLVITTVTSSRLLERIAAAYGARHIETLTGFKWIMHARAQHPDHRFVCGYEEALGYALNDLVPDKDGITAALSIAELASELKDEGKTLLDRLDEIHAAHGVHATGQRSIKFEARPDGPDGRTLAMQHLRRLSPSFVGDFAVRAIHDLATGDTGLPPTDGLVLELGSPGFESARLVVRPSGTEPKMKLYGEVVVDAGVDAVSARDGARAQLRALLNAAVDLATDFDSDPRTSPMEPDPRIAAAFSNRLSGRQRMSDLSLVVRCIDLTTLEGDDTSARIRSLCAKARRPDVANPMVGPVAAVCVYPAFVPVVAEILRGSQIATASVAGAFPSGLSDIAVRTADIADARRSGADEIDIVLNRSALLEGRVEQVAAEFAASREAAGDAHLKVILEVGELDEPHIAAAAQLAMEAGADFIKTSTGKAKVNATPETVWVMAEAIRAFADRTGRRVGLKIAGGVRTGDDALGYVNIVREVLGEDWLTPELFRFGASSLLDAIVTELNDSTAA